jgi:hypothetical protein
MLSGVTADRGAFLDRFLADRSPFGSWFEHVASWRPHLSGGNVLFLRYEEMIADLEGTVKRVAAFAGLALDAREMPRILARSSLAFMKRHGEKFDPRIRRYGPGCHEFIRQGRAGAGVEALSTEQAGRLAARLEELARRLGCSRAALFNPP